MPGSTSSVSSVPTPQPQAVPAPEGLAAGLRLDYVSIDVSWTVPSGVDGVELHVASTSSPASPFIREFASTHTPNADGVKHTYQATAGETYTVEVRSYKTVGSTKTHYDWTPPITVSIPPPPPTGVKAALGSDLKSIDISWTAPSSADGVELRIESHSNPPVVFTQEFASSHTSSADGIMHTYQAKPSEAYKIKVRSYRTSSGSLKIYSAWSTSIDLAIPPEMDTCFPVSGQDGGADQLRCFWTNAASASQYQLEITKSASEDATSESRSAGAASISTLTFEISQTLSTSSSASTYKNISDLSASQQYMARVRVLQPVSSAFSKAIAIDVQRLQKYAPQCVQVIGHADVTGRVPITCWVPYHGEASLTIYYNGVSEFATTVYGGVVDSIMLMPRSNDYVAKWKIGQYSESDAFSFPVETINEAECPADPAIQMPLTTNNAMASGYMFRPHPVHRIFNFHYGVDIGGAYGQAVKAAQSGTLSTIRYVIDTYHMYDLGSSEEFMKSNALGNYIVLRHREEHDGPSTCWYTIYGHLLDPDNSRCRITGLPRTNKHVNAGDIIGCVGSTGTSTAPHLHFEVRHSPNAGRHLIHDPSEFLYPTLTSRSESPPVQNPVRMWCPSVNTNLYKECTWGTVQVAAIPAVWCSSDSSAVTWKWSMPQDVSEFRTSTNAAAAYLSDDWISQTAQTESLRLTGNSGERKSLYVQAKRSSDTYWSWSGAASCVIKPTNIPILCTSTETSITWTWTMPTAATVHQISLDGSTWTDHTLGSKTEGGLSAGDEKTLFVRARASGDEYWSWSGSKSCSTIPSAPSVSCAADADSITWTWPGVIGAANYRTRFDLGGQLGVGNWSEQTGTSKTSDGLSGGSQLTLQVQAGNDAGWSGTDSETCTTTIPVPSAPDVSCTSKASSITWTWPAVIRATRYRISYNGSTWTEQTTRSKTSSGLSSDTTQTLYVQAGNTAGWSTSASAACTTSSTGK